jgi:hypothetical protein
MARRRSQSEPDAAPEAAPTSLENIAFSGAELPAGETDAEAAELHPHVSMLSEGAEFLIETADEAAAEAGGEDAALALDALAETASEEMTLDAAEVAADSVGEAPGKPAKKKRKKKKTKLKLQIAHRTPGRVRMKIPSAKGNPDLLREIGETFGMIPGIERVAVNPTTGSVILHYDTDFHNAFNDRLASSLHTGPARPPSTQIDDLAQKIQNEAEFLASKSDSAKVVVDFFKTMDREIKYATNNLIDLKVVLAVGIIGLTIFEVGATAATPVWLTLAVFTLNHLLEMHRPSVEAAPFAGAPVVFKPA